MLYGCLGSVDSSFIDLVPFLYPPIHPLMQQNGGRSNAYTDMNDTVYFFDLNWDKLEGMCMRLDIPISL